MPGTVSTACKTFQATLRKVWASGSTYAEMTEYLGVTRDQVIRMRDVLRLPLRLDRSKRRKGPRHKDPTPEEIAAACAAIRARHLEARRNEPDRVYRKHDEYVRFRVERASELSSDPLEDLIDNFGDP